MADPVPPQIESPKTFIGVSARELVILGVAGLLGVIVLLIPVHLVVRVGLAVLVVGFGLAVAFGRDRRSGFPLVERRHAGRLSVLAKPCASAGVTKYRPRGSAATTENSRRGVRTAHPHARRKRDRQTHESRARQADLVRLQGTDAQGRCPLF